MELDLEGIINDLYTMMESGTFDTMLDAFPQEELKSIIWNLVGGTKALFDLLNQSGLPVKVTGTM